MWNKTGVTLAVLCSIVALSLTIQSRAARKKTAYVELQLVFTKFNMKLDLQKKFEKETNAKKAYLDSLSFFLQSEKKIIEAMDKEPKERIENFLHVKEEYLTRLEVFNEEKNKVSKKYDSQIFEQLNQYIRDFGAENGYDYIFGTEGNGNLMYAAEKENITNEVIEYINKKYEGK